MDEVGLRELVRAGVKLATRKWNSQAKHVEAFGGTESEILTVIDRIAQLGFIAVDHKQPRVLTEIVQGLLDVYKLGVEDNPPYHLAKRNTWLLIDVVQRIFFLGAAAVRMGSFDQVRELTLQRPLDNRPDTYWIRFAVTMAARGKIEEAFKGKSLIGPASDSLRERTQFFGIFGENMDKVVNYMCQFDFLHCVAAMAKAKDLWACYPSFGGYYSYRTMPVVIDLIRSGPTRAVAPGVTEEDLAGILRDLDKLAREHFFEVSGWDGYAPEVNDFIRTKLQTRPA
jgi:hypothetical protein